MLSFIRAMDSFEVPVLLGLPAKVLVFSNRIYAAVQYDYPVNYGLATALGVSFFGADDRADLLAEPTAARQGLLDRHRQGL